MSRRKQAKPRPIFAYEDDAGTVQGEDIFVPITQTNGHSLSNPDQERDDDADFGEFAPLVMDTGPSQNDEMLEKLRPQSPHSITMRKELPQFAQIPRPEPIKPAPIIPSQQESRLSGYSDNDNKTIPSLIPPTSLSPVMSSTVSSLSGNSEPPSPVATPTTPSNIDENSKSSISSMRRGTKVTRILPVSDEDGEKFICPVCNVSLVNLHDLTVHIRSHNTPVSGSQSNSCKICGKVLSSQSSLDRHMLVHSGERPFLCKVCNMSFTTNGNMHRHSRIHTKEETLKSIGNNQYSQIRRGKSAWRQRISNFLSQSNSPVGDRMKTFQSGMAQDILKNLPNHSQQSVFGRPSEAIPPLVPGMKRQYSGSDLAADWQIPFKRQSLGSDSDISSSSPRKFSYPTIPSQEDESQEESVGEQSKEREDKEVLHCPACPKTFLCKYGLESHLESHPNYQSHCSLCDLTFKNPRKLRLHRLIAHTEKVKEEMNLDGTVDKESEISEMKEETEVKVGFNDLTFVDFSVEKFPLIAKHYFEKNARTSSSTYLNFMCKICSKAFPCESSLILHTYSHTKDKCTQCPICECDYADLNEFHAHMLKHLADKAFEDIRPSTKNEKGDDDLEPERLTKHDFLAMFLLKDEDEKSEQKLSSSAVPKKETPKPVQAEKNINNDYYAKLGQVFAPGIPPMFGQLPMFPPGYQPTLDDFHKMLQVATNMNMLPSMGPNLLMKGHTAGHIPAHSSPSKAQSGYTPSASMATSTPKPAHALSSPVDVKREGQLFGGPEREINEIKMMNSGGAFPCKYCDNTFTSYKTLKAHIRTHLGFSPYQCNLCVYSSADKSSLIRHVRTHSGARPFQCLICDFAFTTRANCERHLRKKHSIMERNEMERSIYLNKFALDASSSIDNFHSPDTICKYCCVDFKFFRALKNHLRSNNSCRQKPFQCQLCNMGFCTKINCLRHVQKQHPEVNNNQTENYIKVIEYFMTDDTDNESVNSDDGIPLYTDDSKTPFDCRSGNSTPQPPAAHSTPKPEALLGRESRHISPSRLVSPLSHISPAVSPLVIKSEPVDRADTPLDFSMKPGNDAIKMEVSTDEPTPAKFSSEETPIDLSVKKGGIPVPIAPKPMNFVQCMYCPMGFSDERAMQRHLHKCHAKFIGDNPALSTQLPTMPFLNQQGKLLLPPRGLQNIAGYQLDQNKPGFYSGNTNRFSSQHRNKSVSATIQNLHDKLKQKKESTPGIDSDLASVTKMIDATDQLNFQAFFKADQSPVSSLKGSAVARPANISKRPGVQISLEHCKAINRELDNLQREGDVDEAALSQVREMALSVKEEVVNQGPATGTGSSISSAAQSPIVSQIVDGQGELHVHDDNSGDGSITGTVKPDSDKGDNAPPKKKRNSYADSPHKLACPYCPRAFPWVSSLTRHLLTHTGQKPFKCPRCPVTFSTKSNRERHLIRKHGVNMLDPLSRQTMDRPYKCPLCVFSSFSTQSNLLKHYRDRHNGANLPENIADIERMSPTAIKAATLEMEIRARENPPKADDTSSLNMNTEEFEEDFDNSVDSSEKMDDDSASFTTDIEAVDDVQKSENVHEKLEKNYQLPAIEKKPSAAESEGMKIAPHLLMAMPELQKMQNVEDNSNDGLDKKLEIDDQQKALSPDINDMKKNIEKIIAEQKAIIEQKAKMEMKIQAEIRSQIEMQRKTDTLSDSVSPIPFDISQESLDPNKPFTGSAERIINPERDNYDVDKITECWKCKEMFPSRKVLVRHLKEHNIDLPFKCYLCDASYESRVNCLNHQANAHDSDWKILKEKNKVMEIEQFSVHMDKVVENNCNKLDTGSVLEIPGTGSDESKMEVISADYMQRKVYCSLCPKRFWSLQDLRRHMRSHTGERPFECDICQKRFTLKHSMMRHRKKHAGAPPRSFDDDDDSNGVDEKASRSAKSTPNRNVTVYPYSSTHTEGVSSTTSSYMFAQGLTGGHMVLGGSNLGSLAPAGAVPGTSKDMSRKSPKTTAPSLDSVKKEFFDCSADMLHNLLGVESATIEQMLDSADSKTAAKYLGLAEAS